MNSSAPCSPVPLPHAHLHGRPGTIGREAAWELSPLARIFQRGTALRTVHSGQQSGSASVGILPCSEFPNFSVRPVTEDEFADLGEEKRKRHLRSLCEEKGLRIAQIRLEGDVLVLVPETLAALPPADELQTLSDRLTALGYRYVSFSVDSED